MPGEPHKSQSQHKSSLPLNVMNITATSLETSPQKSRAGLSLHLTQKTPPSSPSKKTMKILSVTRAATMNAVGTATTKRRVSAGWLKKPLSPGSPKTKTTATSPTKTTTSFVVDKSQLDPAKLSPSHVLKLKPDEESEYSELDSLRLSVIAPSKPQQSTIQPEERLDLDDLHRTQQSLMRLQNDFNAGKLKMFESTQAIDRMKQVREKQESLAKLHFRLHASHSPEELRTGSARTATLNNLKKATMAGLESLKESIQNIDKEIGISRTKAPQH
uniref:Uncharacterized protein n=1 Tax=Romanomermis culicivorax TaxID=13658 RepID=A0A915HLS2_ROMCU